MLSIQSLCFAIDQRSFIHRSSQIHTDTVCECVCVWEKERETLDT